MSKVRIFLAPHFRKSSGYALMFPEHRNTPTESLLATDTAPEYFSYDFELTSSLEKADFVMVPDPIQHVDDEFKRYFDTVKKQAHAIDKPVVVFLRGDLSHREHLNDAIVIKLSEFRHAILPNEIMRVVYVPDLARETPWKPRKKSNRPSVSFCGFAGYPSLSTHIKTAIRHAFLDLKALLFQKPEIRAQKRGIYFRQRALTLLRADHRIDTRFITRPFFFLQAAARKEELARMRQEFLDNLVNADFALCPKGDANCPPTRFFEALALGRIPVLIDTDMVLPLENELDYSKFCIIVPHTKLNAIGDSIVSCYQSLSDQQFEAMRQEARRAFEAFLRYDVFYNRIFMTLRDKGLQALSTCL